jgi:L-serine/L-threonine ammonia-lyase
MVQAYDHPILWKGISSMISEIAEQLPEAASPPDAILCSVGGGSLLGGTLLGTASQGWDDGNVSRFSASHCTLKSSVVHIVALETQGGDSFYHSVLTTESASHTLPAGVTSTVSSEHGVAIATFSAITTLATSLAATSSAGSVIKMAVDRRENGGGGLTCVTVPDELSMQAALEFAGKHAPLSSSCFLIESDNFSDEHKLLVELAASTTLTPIYSPVLFDAIFGDTLQPVSGQRRTLVFIVCGGSKVSLADMVSYRAHLEQMNGAMGQAWVDGFAVAL